MSQKNKDNNNNRRPDNANDATVWNINTVDTSRIEELSKHYCSDMGDDMQEFTDFMQEMLDGVSSKDLIPPASVINPKRMAIVQKAHDALKRIFEEEREKFNIGLRGEASSTYCSIVITVFASCSMNKKHTQEFASIISQADFWGVDMSTIKDTFVITIDYKDVFIPIGQTP